jgi:hypothetical protein
LGGSGGRRSLSLRPTQAKFVRPKTKTKTKNKKQKRAGYIVQVVESLPGMYKALDSIPSTVKGKKGRGI